MNIKPISIILFLIFGLFDTSAQSRSFQLKDKNEQTENFQSNLLILDSLFKEGNFQVNASKIDEILLNTDLPNSLYESKITLSKYYEEYIKYLLTIEQFDLKTVNKHRYNLSKIFKDINESDNQLEQLEAIIYSPIKDLHTCLSYADLASLFINKKGDPFKAFEYLNTALSDNVLMSKLDYELLIRLKIIYVYAKKDQSNTNNENIEELKIIQSHMSKIENDFYLTEIQPYKLSNMYNNVGMYHASLGNLDIEINMYQKALENYIEQKDTVRMLKTLNNIGANAADLGNEALAKSCFERIYRESSDLEQRSTAYANLAYFLYDDNPKEKLPYFYKAICLLSEIKYKGVKNFELPDLEQILKSQDPTTFPIYFTDLSLAYTQIYDKTKETIYLVKALKTLKLIEEIYDVLRYNSLNEKTKLYWINRAVDVHSMAVEIGFLLNDPYSVFRNMEKNKALLLQENIKTFQSRLRQNIPRSLLEKEYKMFYDFSACAQKLQNDPENKVLKDEFSTKNKAYKNYMDSLRNKYPNYVKSKQGIRTIGLDQAIEEFVSEDENLIEYVLNNQKAYGIFCSDEGKILFEIDNVKQLQKDLQLMDSLLHTSIMDSETIEKFQLLSEKLFKALFPFENAESLLKNKILRIIPDQNLRKLPFEALSFDKNLKLSDSYLINICDISYLHSISVYKQLEQKENNPSRKLLAISPDVFQDSKLESLEQSEELIQQLKTINRSKIFQSKNATKRNFLNQLSEFEIVHINTHAGLDTLDKTPWLAFYDQTISWNELFGKENNAELVVLDACKTNDGKLARGEGMLNLSRSFFYNGTRSVLSSFWNVNERSGNKIMNRFYDYLKQGNSKSKALQLSKKDYLKDHQYSEILPYYWATFTLTGSNTPIEINTNNNQNLYLIISGLAILALALIFGKSNLNKSRF